VGKTALIVDDSRSARVVLKKMLETHELAVDTAESAEDALDYLNDNRPDVIFMDHLMPGMDGFEAVSAIKNNPDTATIPIMMYTSQEGEVYVGQARALGAVGVLPKQVEPVEVSKVLASLRVIGGDDEAAVTAEAATSTDGTGEYPGLETLDQDLRILIRDLFDQQRAVLRRDLRDGYETIAARVVDEIRPVETVDSAEIETVDPSGSPRVLHSAIVVLTVITIVFAWLYWRGEQHRQDLQEQHAALQQAFENQRTSDAEDSLQISRQITDYQQTLGSLFAATINGIEWGANQATTYAFEELPLGDARLTVIEQLTDQLVSVDFTGRVRIETHVANFCVSVAGAEGYRLAADGLPAVNCDRTDVSPGEAYELGLRQSVAFANFIRLADASFGGRVRYEIVSLGNSDPLIDYPATPVGVTAAAWNEIAASNNRVEISILPDGF